MTFPKGNLFRNALPQQYPKPMTMASGISFPDLRIDLMAAQLVQSLKCNLPGISLTAAIPFEGQAERYNIYDKRVYRRLLELADKVIVLSDCYYPRCFLDRDEFMVENASYLIAYYDGRGKGGTYYTVKKARARSIPIINVY